MSVEIYRISTEFVWWKVESPDDLASATVEVACLEDPADLPGESDWVSATLVSPAEGTFGDGENWWVKLLVGPDFDGNTGLDLSDRPTSAYPIDFQSWIRITDVSERPVRKPGVITIL